MSGVQVDFGLRQVWRIAVMSTEEEVAEEEAIVGCCDCRLLYQCGLLRQVDAVGDVCCMD